MSVIKVETKLYRKKPFSKTVEIKTSLGPKYKRNWRRIIDNTASSIGGPIASTYSYLKRESSKAITTVGRIKDNAKAISEGRLENVNPSQFLSFKDRKVEQLNRRNLREQIDNPNTIDQYSSLRNSFSIIKDTMDPKSKDYNIRYFNRYSIQEGIPLFEYDEKLDRFVPVKKDLQTKSMKNHPGYIGADTRNMDPNDERDMYAFFDKPGGNTGERIKYAKYPSKYNPKNTTTGIDRSYPNSINDIFSAMVLYKSQLKNINELQKTNKGITRGSYPNKKAISTPETATGEDIKVILETFGYSTSYIDLGTSIHSLSDDITSKWNSRDYLGNPIESYRYKGYERRISFNVKMFASTIDQMRINMNKLNFLYSLCMPTAVDSAIGYRANFIKLRLGSLYNGLRCKLDSVKPTFDDLSPWGVDSGMQYPYYMDIALSFTVIEDVSFGTRLSFTSPSYSTSGANINEEDTSNKTDMEEYFDSEDEKSAAESTGQKSQSSSEVPRNTPVNN